MTALPPGWQFALDVHPPDWRFASGATWIAGWIWPEEGNAVTDLRAWIDQRPFLGLHGLPRPGLDETLPGPSRPPYAGFSFLLHPHAGATRLRIEARGLDGRWQDVFATHLRVAPDTLPTSTPNLLAAHVNEVLPALMREAIRQPEAPLSRLAHEKLARRLASPLNALPNPPFVGALEEPRATGRVRHGRLSITGWLTHRTARIVRLTAVLDPLREVVVPHGLPRSDLGAEFPDLAGCTHVAFCAQVDLPSALPAPVLMKVFAELDNGEKHLVFAQRFQPELPFGFEKPVPAASRLHLIQATWALARAGKKLGLATRGTWSTARASWQMFPRPPSQKKVPRTEPLVRTGQPLRVLVATHNLNFEGAPRLVLELSRFFASQTGASLHVVSPTEGPLRALFEEAGMRVSVLPLAPAFATTDLPSFHEQLRAVSESIDWTAVDLVIANTMVSFWVVLLAEQAGKPSVLYVHESAPIRRLFAPLLSPMLFPAVEDAFRRARRVVFTAEASRQIFQTLDQGHFCVLPSWLDVAAIERFASTHDKAALRSKHGLDPAAVVVLNLGTVCERKGQHVFVQALRVMAAGQARLTHRPPVEYVMVGARDDDFLKEIRAQIAEAGLKDIRIVGETRENFDFHRLADLLVCTSFEESSPRVLLEAAAFGTPIVSTDVNGIPEMVTGHDAWLVEAGDHHHLATALRAALAAHASGDTTRARRAQAAVKARYDERVSLPQHVAVIMGAMRS